MTDEAPGQDEPSEKISMRSMGSGLAYTSPAPKLAARLLGELLVLGVLGVELVILELLEVEQGLVRSWVARMSSSSFQCMASESRFLCVWIKNTIKKVTIVVPVLMTSCRCR